MTQHKPTIAPIVKPVVLVADEDPAMRRAIRRTLESFEVAEAADGAEAIAMLSSGLHVDAVTLDLDMPNMSATEALGTIHRRWPTLPVVILSANLRDEAELLAAGAVACLDKLRLAELPAILVGTVRDKE